jgi:hypothetical protein
MSAPVFPIRRVLARFDRKSGMFLPCSRGGTLILPVDANGHSVRAAEVRPFTTASGATGWMLGEPSSMYDPEVFKEWLQANPQTEWNR